MNREQLAAAKELARLLADHRDGAPWATDATIRASAKDLLTTLGIMS